MAGELEHIRPTRPSQTNLAARTKNIIWCDAAGNDHSIKAVYWSPSNNANDLKLIWLRDHIQRTLVMDNSGYVLMKYKPKTTKTVSSVGIFTDNSGDNGKYVFIFNDSGVLIAKDNDEIQIANTTKYNYTGYLRTITIDPSITLTQGHTYWIAYYFQNCQEHADTYFQNENGHYKRLGFSNSNASVLPDGNVFDVSSYELNDLADYMLSHGNAGDLFKGIQHQGQAIFEKENINDTYYGSITAINDYTITLDQLTAVPVNNIFLLVNSHYRGNYKICKCTGHNSATDYTELATQETAIGYNGTGYICTKINDGSSVINLSSAQTETNKLHYLEINGVEVQADERGIE